MINRSNDLFAFLVYILLLAKFTSPFHACSTLRTKPFAFRWLTDIDAWIVKPLERTALVVAGDHVAVGHLITNAVTRFIGVILPFGVCLSRRVRSDGVFSGGHRRRSKAVHVRTRIACGVE